MARRDEVMPSREPCTLRELADSGRADGLLTAIAIDGKWLRGVLGGELW
jgi:hypothetical protein